MPAHTLLVPDGHAALIFKVDPPTVTAKRYVETEAQAAAARIIRNQLDNGDHDTP